VEAAQERDAPLIAEAACALGMDNPAVTALSGGSRNRCYRLAQGPLDVVLRIAGDGDATYAVERGAELLAQRTAARQGLAPRLLLEDPERGYVVMEHLSGPVWTRAWAASPAGASRLGEWLGRLHAVAVPPGLRRISFVEVLDDYCARLAPGLPAAALADRCAELAHAFEPPAAPVLCHNDLHHRNLVESAGRLCAVDWEYAGAGDPVMDLAGYVAYHDLSGDATRSLLAAYAAHGYAPTRESLSQARWLFEAVWWAWLELLRRETCAEPPELAATRAGLERRLARPAREAGTPKAPT